MKRTSKSNSDEQFQIALGKRIEEEIKKKGYSSAHDFWIHKAGDAISRSSLNYIVGGQSDVKLTTLKQIARLLGVKCRDLLDFE